MFANPAHSRVVLINPARTAPGDIPAERGRRRRDALTLLPIAYELFGVEILALGEYQPLYGFETLQSCVTVLDIKACSLWRDPRFTAWLAASDTGVVFLGGAWLEEDVFIAALEAAGLGYDVRVLADLSVARSEDDRTLMFDRFALHGILTMTVRQAILEWSACRDDPELKERVRQLLS
jgi:hypothetical protein